MISAERKVSRKVVEAVALPKMSSLRCLVVGA